MWYNIIFNCLFVMIFKYKIINVGINVRDILVGNLCCVIYCYWVIFIVFILLYKSWLVNSKKVGFVLEDVFVLCKY